MKRFFNNEEGATFVTFAVTAAVLLTVTLAAISLSSNTAGKSKFAQSVDSALLAAVSASSGKGDGVLSETAKQFFQSNMPDSNEFKLGTIQVQKVADKDNQWKINATGSYNSGTFGNAALSHTAKVEWEGSTTSEIVLVGNVSGSMCTKDVSTAGDAIYKFEKVENCTGTDTKSKFNAMKKGFREVLRVGVEVVKLPRPDSGTSGATYAYRVGVVPFNHKVKLPSVAETMELPNARKTGFRIGTPIEEQYKQNDPLDKRNLPLMTESNMYTNGWDSIGTKPALPNTRVVPAPLRANEASLVIRDSNATVIKAADANFYNNFNDVAPLPMVYPLVDIAGTTTGTSTKDSLDRYIESFYQDYQGMGWNRTNIGLLTAGLMLDPAYKTSFGGATPEAFNTASTEKIIILMTDGANIGCCFASFPGESFDNQHLEEYAVDSAHMIGIDAWKELGGTWESNWAAKYGMPAGTPSKPYKGVCGTLKENNVKIYTIGFGIPKNSAGGKAREVLRTCSSGDQFFFDLDQENEADLKEAFSTIAQSLVKLRLVE